MSGDVDLRAAANARFPDRAAIESGALAGKALEFVWLDDPIDAFYIEIRADRIAGSSNLISLVSFIPME